MKRNFLYGVCILLLMFFCQGIMAQQRTIKGIVKGDDGLPLPGATVLVKGTTNGTQTDFDGNYTIKVNVGDMLEFSYVGFSSQTIAAVRDVIDVVLESETSELEEVIVTGYATQTRRTLATSISKLDNKVLESTSRSNVATALQGTIAGMNVIQNTGQPGSTPSITLRGGTAFSGSGTPLVLIDGVPSSFYALNSDDIESMEVLKDAASTAIYGARAANGVILVTTKKGKTGRSSITFKSKTSYNAHREDPMQYLGAADYVAYNRLGVQRYRDIRNDTSGATFFTNFSTGETSFGTGNNTTNSIYTTMVLNTSNSYLLDHGWQTIEDPLNPGTQLIFYENDWLSTIYQSSFTNDYTLSFDGGNDKGSYYFSLGYLNEDGIVKTSGFQRFSGTINASYKIRENLKASTNVIYAHSSIKQPYQTGGMLFQRLAGQAPTARIYANNPDGTWSDEYVPGTDSSFGNFLYYKDKFVRDNLEQRITASGQLDWQFAKNFNLMGRGTYFSINNTNEAFNKAYVQSSNNITTRIAGASYTRTLRHQYTAVLSYKNTFANSHNLNVLLGSEYFRHKRFDLSAYTRNSPTDLIHTLNAGAEVDGKPNSEHTEYAIASVFGQMNYDYKDKYLLGLTFRYDGTSHLANDKYEIFPGVSLGWNLHNENFYRNSYVSKIVNKIKPRVSYGVNGNIETLTNYGVYGIYSTSNPYDSLIGYYNSSLPNLNLRWERSTTFNFGLDLGLFNNRVNIIADYFIRDVKNKHSSLVLPLWTGYSSITTNNGTLRNKGLEIELTLRPIQTENFNWNISAVYYHVRNYAHKLPDNGVENNRQGGYLIYDPATQSNIYVGGYQQGQRIGSDLVVAYIPDGVYQTQAQIDEHDGRRVEFATRGSTRFLGDTRWVDTNNDGVINYLDRQVIGRITPKYTGGFSTNLNYKKVNLYVKTDFAVGHLLFNERRLRGLTQAQGNQNGPVEILQTWSPTNPTSNIPAYVFTDPQSNHTANSKFGSINNSNARLWEKGDYLALREVTLSYDVDPALLNNSFKSFRVYVTGANLKYFTEYSGSTPELGNISDSGISNGVESGRFPTPRTFTLGVNLSF